MKLCPDRNLRMLNMAGRLGLRGHGRVEPNPMVGCVIARDEAIVGWGYHRQFGGPHAEIEALAIAGDHARGADVYVTLEPCSHDGKTGACTTALLDAGVRSVVYAQADPHPAAQGGAVVLRVAGVNVVQDDRSVIANETSAPFRRRIQTGLPWVIAKWAQTLDGRIATRAGESQWISSARSRRLVHRERGRVDAVLTGIGTVLADDPMLTARRVRLRRRAIRVVFDPHLETPVESALVRTAGTTPTLLACFSRSIETGGARAATLRDAGVTLLEIPSRENVPLASLLRTLVAKFDVTTVLTECGGGLLGQLFEAGLVSETLVFLAPRLMGDIEATAPVRGLDPPTLDRTAQLQLQSTWQRDGDLVVLYRNVMPSDSRLSASGSSSPSSEAKR